ncbi:MAG: hypothetical protein JOZ15_13950 [Acidobacteria bacterium]|nr:hypothetical protein [Acidobacteriota bacterium]
MNARTLALAALLLAGAPQLSAQEAAPLEGDGDAAQSAAAAARLFTGTWMAYVTPDTPVVPPFYELITFHADGTLVETESDLTAPPFSGTVGQGVWRGSPSGGPVITYTEIHLEYDPATGAPIGTLELVGRVVLGKDGNTLSGETKATVYDLKGNVLFQGNGPITGTRVENAPF